MFTGIVEEVGRVVAVEPRGNLVRLTVQAETVLGDARLGDSIAHNGTCLTICELGPGRYACDVMAETLRATTLGSLRPGDRLNLERAIAAGGRFGGHFVQGHVDGVGTVARIAREDRWVTYTLEPPGDLLPHLVAKGSVALDGVSLTIVERFDAGFSVALIPHTLAHTTLSDWTVGRRVNIEADILAKYVAAALGRGRPTNGTMSLEWLAEQGY